MGPKNRITALNLCCEDILNRAPRKAELGDLNQLFYAHQWTHLADLTPSTLFPMPTQHQGVGGMVVHGEPSTGCLEFLESWSQNCTSEPVHIYPEVNPLCSIGLTILHGQGRLVHDVN